MSSDPDTLDRDPVAPLPAEVQFSLIVVAILIVIAFAGLPGTREKTAGDGSSKLRHGWAAQRAADVNAPPTEGADASGLDR